MQYLLYGFAFYALLVAARYFLVFRQVVGLTLQYTKYELKADEELPDYLKDLFQIAVRELEQLGFKFCCYMEVDHMVQDYWKDWVVLLYNQSFQTFATTRINFIPDSVNLFTLEFHTFFDDGGRLLTVNGSAHNLSGELPKTILQDPYTSLTENHWQAHKEKLEELAKIKRIQKMSASAFIEAQQSHEAAYIDSLVATGKAVRAKKTALFYLTLATAIKTTIKITRGSAKYTALLKKRMALAKTTPAIIIEIPVEVEVEAFQRFERYQRRQARKDLKLWSLIGSLVLFVLSFTPLFNWQTILILVGVLFFHEAGHFLAMKLCGYKDTSIFFLPFFGAAASGHKDNATLTEKVLVLLAGPLPGLLFGAAIGFAMQGNLHAFSGLFTVVNWLLLLNYLNLLPILPLDGGRILNLLVFSRHPYTDVFFKIFTVGFFVLMGVSLRDPISLPLGIAIAFSIPASFRSAKILKRLQRQRGQPTDESDSLLHTIFRTLGQTGYKSLPFIQKYRLVKDIAQRCNESRASGATRLSLLALYLVCVLGGLVLLFLTFMPGANASKF